MKTQKSNPSYQKMNVNDFVKEFLRFEGNYKLFDLKVNDVFIWDLIRYSIFNYLWLSFSDLEKPSQPNAKILVSKLKVIKEICLFWINLITRLPYRWSVKDIFIMKNSFSNIEDDKILYNAYASIEKSHTLAINSQYLNVNILPFNRINLNNAEVRDFVIFLSNSLNANFNLRLDKSLLTSIVRKAFVRFHASAFKYKIILTLFSPKRVHINPSFVDKGLYFTCKELSIPVLEYQHGCIDETHILYNYSSNTDINKLYLPKYMMCFSDFWVNQMTYPVDKFIVGSHLSFKSDIHKKNNNSLLVIGQPCCTNLIIKYLSWISDMNIFTKIGYSMHNGESNYHQTIKKSLFNHDVFIHDSHINAVDLFSEYDSVMILQSSVFYEALYHNLKILLIPELKYTRFNNLFGTPNVLILSNKGKSSILDFLSQNRKPIDYSYLFSNFDSLTFKLFLEKTCKQ